MKAAMITRSSLRRFRGGDTIQVEQTALALSRLGIDAEIRMADEVIDYSKYDLLHFFNLVRPADILKHVQLSRKPFVLSPVFVDYSAFDKKHRKGISGSVFRMFSAGMNEYMKTVFRWIRGNDEIVSKSYLWKGHRASMKMIANKAATFLPNSPMEMESVRQYFKKDFPYTVVPNGVDPLIFRKNDTIQRDNKLVICVARIEGIKNQLNLVKALNNTEYTLVLIGATSPNQQSYLKRIKSVAAGNIHFTGALPQFEIMEYYQRAGVHVLPSWFETCGLSSLEAAATGCPVVITDMGFTRDYFGDHAHYCNPEDPASILQAVESAAGSSADPALAEIINQQFTWQQAAKATAAAYHQILET
ncbi:MAG: glycosyltransferase family 4 protein [Chitinophagaceae bacterium]|nr:glycosyltransferase family 4 protein [Chitinophagaceae bacterium]